MPRTTRALAALLAAVALTGCSTSSDVMSVDEPATSTSASTAPSKAATDTVRPQAETNAAYAALWTEFAAGSQAMQSAASSLTEATPEAFNTAYGWDADDLATVTEVSMNTICITSRDDVTLAVTAEASGESALLMGEGDTCTYDRADAAIVIVMGVGGTDAKVVKGKNLLNPDQTTSNKTDPTKDAS